MYKLEELKKTENVNKIIMNILESAHNSYRSYTVFDSKVPKYGNKYNMGYIFVISKSCKDIYNLKFRLLENVTKNTINKECCYCNNHYGDLMFKCCNNTFNLSCGLMNGFVCDCVLNRNILKHTNNITECCVCLEDTKYKTKCNHPLCEDCLSKIRKSNKFSNCPMCRERLNILDKCKYTIKLNLKKDNVKCNIIYFE